MSRPRPVPFPTGLVVKNGSNRRSRISAGMPGPLSTTRTTTRCRSQRRGHLDPTGVRNGIERVVDQVRPDLVELADEAADAREVGFDVDGDGDRFRPRLRLEHGDGVAQARRQVHGLGHRGLVHVRESLDGRDQAGDPRRGLLNLRGDPANRASGGRPPEDRAERRSARPPRQSGRARRASRRFRPAARRWRRRRRDPRASRRWRPRARPAGSETARRARRVARQDARTASMAASWASVSLDGAQRARRLLGVLQAVLEQRGAAFDRGGRVVQLVGQPGGQLPERDHLLVVQAARREDRGCDRASCARGST